ncbi:hypothetical protein predicted by Glimmer/Critica [Helicobacter pylori B8]|uniref:Uncharacterized protein n=1 Tax=Helicobacter pylori (strain B8) TaxID=693745 RepID=D7FD99_HELP3|nr:hypothetical protein predicted by Glimmer/Critica [Helicobacter pylori B8]
MFGFMFLGQIKIDGCKKFKKWANGVALSAK